MRSALNLGVSQTALWRSRFPVSRRRSQCYGLYNPSDGLYVTSAVTFDGSAHTMGSYAEVIAATTFDVGFVAVLPYDSNTAATDTHALLDLAVGGAGSEEVVVSSIYAGHASVQQTYAFPVWYEFPLFIRSGSRVAIRGQGAVGGDSMTVCVALFPYEGSEGRAPASKIVTIGDNRAASGGVSCTADKANPQKNSWTEITSATSEPLIGFTVCIGPGSTTTIATQKLSIDIGYGPSGSEAVIGADLLAYTGTNEEVFVPRSTLVWSEIPAGTRLTARFARSGSGTNTVAEIILLGIRSV